MLEVASTYKLRKNGRLGKRQFATAGEVIICILGRIQRPEIEMVIGMLLVAKCLGNFKQTSRVIWRSGFENFKFVISWFYVGFFFGEVLYIGKFREPRNTRS